MIGPGRRGGAGVTRQRTGLGLGRGLGMGLGRVWVRGRVLPPLRAVLLPGQGRTSFPGHSALSPGV